MSVKDFNKFIEVCFLLGIKPTWESLYIYKDNLKRLKSNKNIIKTMWLTGLMERKERIENGIFI